MPEMTPTRTPGIAPCVAATFNPAATPALAPAQSPTSIDNPRITIDRSEINGPVLSSGALARPPPRRLVEFVTVDMLVLPAQSAVVTRTAPCYRRGPLPYQLQPAVLSAKASPSPAVWSSPTALEIFAKSGSMQGMAKIVAAMGPSGLRVGERIRDLRQSHGLTLHQLAERLVSLDRPIDLSALAKIEKGQRRVDVDDLVALALALRVSPNWLLLPSDASDGRVELTAGFGTTGSDAWLWALRDRPRIFTELPSVPDRMPTRTSNFWFLQDGWPDIYDLTVRAEKMAYADPSISCFYSRYAMESTLAWLTEFEGKDPSSSKPSPTLLLTDLAESGTIVDRTAASAREILRRGSEAVHTSRQIYADDALAVLAELFEVMKWLARSYSFDSSKLPAREVAFDPSVVISNDSKSGIIDLFEESSASDSVAVPDEPRSDSDQITHISVTVESGKSQPTGSRHVQELESRIVFEHLLEEAGWTDSEVISRDQKIVLGKSNTRPRFVDYILWDGSKPLAIIESKVSDFDQEEIFNNLQIVALDLESLYGQRPLLFCFNGSDVSFWDEIILSPRQIRGFYNLEDLRRKVASRSRRRSLEGLSARTELTPRPYQQSIVRDVCNAFEVGGRTRALVAMAAGSGMTFISLALIDILARAGWTNRVLFLSNMNIIRDQTLDRFREYLPAMQILNNPSELDRESYVYVAGLHTLNKLVREVDDSGTRKYGQGFFDLIVIDDVSNFGPNTVHNIVDNFDARVVGLTTSPADGLDSDLFKLFELDGDQLTASYKYSDAVASGDLVPYKFSSIKIAPEVADPSDSVNPLGRPEGIDAVLKLLLERGIQASDGRVGKTIIFAGNILDANLIEHRFRVNNPEYEDDFAMAINSQTAQASVIMDRFKQRDSMPRIAISSGKSATITGSPDVVNLVFMNRVHSSSMFWQMLSQGSRISPDLFGVGQPKDRFQVLDFGGNAYHLAYGSRPS